MNGRWKNELARITYDALLAEAQGRSFFDNKMSSLDKATLARRIVDVSHLDEGVTEWGMLLGTQLDQVSNPSIVHGHM
jgi:hypothetical protein